MVIKTLKFASNKSPDDVLIYPVNVALDILTDKTYGRSNIRRSDIDNLNNFIECAKEYSPLTVTYFNESEQASQEINLNQNSWAMMVKHIENLIDSLDNPDSGPQGSAGKESDEVTSNPPLTKVSYRIPLDIQVNINCQPVKPRNEKIYFNIIKIPGVGWLKIQVYKNGNKITPISEMISNE